MRFQRVLCCTMVCMGSFVSTAEADDKWMMYNFDSEGTRHNKHEDTLSRQNVGGLQIDWIYPTPASVSATPVVRHDTVYAGDLGGTFYALDADDGDLQWSTQVVGGISASAMVMGNRVIFGDLAGYIYGLNRQTGAIVWQIRPNTHQHAQIYGSPTKIGGHVAIGVASFESFAAADPNYPCCSARGSVVLLDPDDGDVQWQTYFITAAEAANGSSGASVWSTPTYDSDLGLIYATTGQNFSAPATAMSDSIIALNVSTGQIVWANQRLPNDIWNLSFPQGDEHPDHDIGDSAQVYTLPSGERVVGAGQKNGFYHVLDAATGATLNTRQLVPAAGTGGLFADSAIANGVVFANGSNWTFPNPPVMGALVAITGDATQELWRFTVNNTANFSGVAVANGVVYFESYNGNLYALNSQTGALLAQVAIGAAASGPSVVDGRVYAGTGDPWPFFFGGGAAGSIVALGL